MKATKWLAALAFMSVVTGACGRGDDDSGGSDNTAAPSEPATGAAATTVAGGAESTAAAATGDPIKIGVPGAFTGPSGSLGEAQEQGLELKKEQINNSGGILGGRPIELVYRDHEAVPDKGVTNIRELIEQENVVALVGETNSGVAAAEAPVVNQAGIPWVITISTGTAVTQQPDPNFLFRVSLVDKDQTSVAFDAAQGEFSKIALMSDTSGYGQGGHTDLIAAMEAAGVQPVADETYKVGDSDMTPQIDRIRAAGADVIINWGLGAEAAQIRRAMEQVGLDIPMIGSWGLSMPNYPELAGPLADGTLVVQAFSFEGDRPGVTEFLDAYEAKFGGTDIRFPNGVANSYDGLGLLAAAIDSAGSTDPAAIRDALLEVNYEGLIKNYEQPWSDTNREAITAPDMFITVIEGSAFKPVES